MNQIVDEHLSGDIPSLVPSSEASNQRIPLGLDEQQKLLHTLDYWFTYAIYAGFPPRIILASAIAGTFGVFVLLTLLIRGVRSASREAKTSC